MNREIKLGSVIAYINIALNLLVNLFLTPFLISSLGDGEYGVYKTIQSFSSQLSIMSFGIATLVTRNVVYYNSLDKKREKENFLFAARVISIVLAAIIACIGVVLYFSLDVLYANSLSPSELSTAKVLYSILVANIAVTILCDPFTGLIKAHEKFVICNGLNTLKIVIRVVVIVVLLNLGVGSIGIVVTDFGISLVMLIFTSLYGRIGLKEKAKFYYVDKEMLKSCFTFSIAVFLQAIINQVNQNLDNVILGAMTSTSIVTLYSCGLMLYTSFNSLVTVVGGMYGPRATKLVAKGSNGQQLTEFAVEPARIQSMIAFLGITGFVLFGKNFINIWLGEGYEDVYRITLILIIPVLLPLIESITNNILDALLKRLARSIILGIMCIVNVFVSIILINRIGYIGAALGTAFSLIVGHGIIMNIYLYKKIHLNIPFLFKNVFRGTLPSCLISVILGIPISLLPNTFIWFCVKVLLYCALFLVIMYFVGMNQGERELVKSIFKKFKLLRGSKRN